MPRPADDRESRLEPYRRKRSAGRTPEPFGGRGYERPGLFVVQKHAARRMHYDFRLEIGGVLRSWAVPKGPSFDPQEKRLAVATEDHPLEYGDFEGVIPADNYGAGAVLMWDRGLAVHQLDPEEGVREGKLLFELRGYKLRGTWTLVRTSRNPKEWLLIKKPDAAAGDHSADDLDPGSVFSGLTVDELAAGTSRAAAIRERLEELGARRARLRAARVRPMLAQLEHEPFSRAGWLFELKYDGYRLLAARSPAVEGDGGAPRVQLLSRNGLDLAVGFPELRRAVAALPFESFVLDGEVVVLDEEARPSFQRLQQRARLSRAPDVERATVELPAVFYAFDLLGFEEFDLRPLPLSERKALLREVLPAAGPLRYTDHVEERGEELYAEIRRMGLEGMLAKKADAAYRAGRSGDWIKVRADRVGDFAVVGFTRPKQGRAGFGALHLAALHGPQLLFAGRVGSGFSTRQLDAIRRQLETHRRAEPACRGPLPKGSEHLWVEPRLVVEVRFTEYTDEGQLRHPVFLRLREDKTVADCVRDDLPPPRDEGARPATVERPPLRLSRLEKVFWPEDGHTKGDLLTYYRTVASWLLPYLEERPLVLDRYPDGIAGKNFFQKNAPEFTPEWVRTETVWSEDSGKETRYFVCDDEEELLYLVNSGAIPLHLWSSRLSAIQTPDWCILDLDAKQASFAQAAAVARSLRRLCRRIDLPCFVKTSGATGLHVLVPLGGNCTHEQARQLGEVLARVAAQEQPEIASTARTPSAREGKVYVDYLQNGYGKLLVAPYSVRPLPGAPVSMPLRWRELRGDLDPRRFNLESAPRRLRSWKRDPLRKVLELEPDLPAALGRLAEMV